MKQLSVLILATLLVLTFASCGGGGGGDDTVFSISYNANGAESGTPPASQNGDSESSLAIQNNTGNLTKSGYLFDGWNTNADGSGKTYAPGTKYSGNDLRLYAKWAAIYNVQNMGGSPSPALKAPGSSNLKILGLTEKGKTLSSINIPSSIDGNTIKAIGSGAFQDCSFITELTLPATVTTIEGNAFSGCTGITTVTIPEGVTSIGAGAFSGCTSLTSLVINSTVPPAIDGDILDGTSAKVMVPETAIGAYASAWSACSASIEGSYTVTFDDQGATTPVNPETKMVNPPATTVDALPTAPEKTGFVFGGWFTEPDGAGEAFTESTTVSGSITVYAKWNPVYTVTIDSMTNGVVTSDKSSAESGETVTLTVTPASGYGLDSLTVTKSGGGTVDVSGDGNTRTFTMPTSDVTVTATFSLLLVYTSTPGDRTGVSVGDIVLADKKTVAPSEYTSYKAEYESVNGVPVGVVAYMGGNEVEDLYKPFLAGTAKVGTNGKVYMVGLLQSGSDLVWAPTDTTGYNTIFSTSYNDGSGNWAVIKAADSAGTATAELIATNYPAFSYAATYTATGYTSGWYLPALAELKRIALNSDTINDGFTAITGAGGTANALTENNYWSSSQFDNGAPYKTHAGYVNFSADKSICTNKSTMFFVRVVRALDD